MLLASRKLLTALCAGILLSMCVVGMPLANAISIDGENVTFKTNTFTASWQATFEPYYFTLTNDTMTFADDGGEFSITVYSSQLVQLTITTWQPFNDNILIMTAAGSNQPAQFIFSGVQPGAVYELDLAGVKSLITADAQGNLHFSSAHIGSSLSISLRMISTPPAFANSPIITMWDHGYWEYAIEIYPANSGLIIEKMPYWMSYDKINNILSGDVMSDGSYYVSLHAFNIYGDTWLNFTITVNCGSPRFTSSPELVLNKFDYYEYHITYFPSSGVITPLKYPQWLKWNNHDNTLSGQAIRTGSFDVSLKLENSDGVAYQNFTIVVNAIPVPNTNAGGGLSIDLDLTLLYVLIAVGVGFILFIAYTFKGGR